MPKISPEQMNAVRTDILQHARTVFMRKGYEATTMKDIVLETGRSFGGVYMYYSSKEELFYDLLKHQYEQMAEDFTQEDSGDSRRGAWGQICSFLDKQAYRAEKANDGLAPCMYEFFIVGRRDEPRKEMIRKRHEAVFSSLLAMIRNGIEQGDLRPVQPAETVAHFIVSFLDGIFVESMMTGPDRISLREQVELVKGFIRSVLRPSEPEEAH